MITCIVRTFRLEQQYLEPSYYNITLFHMKTLNGKDANESINVSRHAKHPPYHITNERCNKIILIDLIL